MEIKSSLEFLEKITGYPKQVEPSINTLRQLIVATSRVTEGCDYLIETLKWGEPSFLSPHGSTIRIDWKKKNPEYVAMYFKCTSRLVPTFKDLYPSTFHYEGNRALLFHVSDHIPTNELAHCISLGLTYHKIKHLPMLGT